MSFCSFPLISLLWTTLCADNDVVEWAADEYAVTAAILVLVLMRNLFELDPDISGYRNGVFKGSHRDILLSILSLAFSLDKDLRTAYTLSKRLDSESWNALSRTTLPRDAGQRKDKERWMRNRKEPRITLTSHITIVSTWIHQ